MTSADSIENGLKRPVTPEQLDWPLDRFQSWYNSQNPGWTDRVWRYLSGLDAKTRDYSLAYAGARQQGLDHEQAVRVAKIINNQPNADQGVQPESVYNRRMLLLPLSSPLNIPDLPAQEQRAEALARAPIPQTESGLRMAMRYGLPALGGALGAYALMALMNPKHAESEVTA